MKSNSQKRSFQVGSATFGDGRLTIIAGPCVIESAEHAMMMARECAERARAAGLDFVFKTSFDKANRSSIKSFRGIGMDPGLEILLRIKNELGVPVLTDVHDVAQIGAVAEVADVLQIPAFLCRQTDLVSAAARSGFPFLPWTALYQATKRSCDSGLCAGSTIVTTRWRMRRVSASSPAAIWYAICIPASNAADSLPSLA